MQLQLQGKAALVSGASAGIGRGIAKVLAGQGVRLAITARRLDLLDQLAAEIADCGGFPPVVIAGDITDTSDVTRIVANATSVLGSIDILINSAGGSRPLEGGAADDIWAEAYALNFTAARHLAEAVLPSMREKRWGRIINISGSMEPRKINAAAHAKAALHIWAKALSCEVAADGITVNTIPPGRINSEQVLAKLHPTEESRRDFIAANIPVGYFGEPEDIGHLVAFLSSPLARYITGTVIPIDGGMHRFAQ